MAEEGDDEDGTGVVIPFPGVTPQVFGRDYEKERAKKDGYRLHPGSGAGRIKHDASDEESVIEYKTARKSFALQGQYLQDLFAVAIRQGKEARMEIHFREANITAHITITKGII